MQKGTDKNIRYEIHGSGQEFPNALQFKTDLCQRSFVRHSSFIFRLGLQMLSGARDSKLFLIEEMFDFQNQFHIFFSIKPLTGRCALGIYAFELCFPEPENVCWEADDVADLSDFEVKLVRQLFLKWPRILHFTHSGPEGL